MATVTALGIAAAGTAFAAGLDNYPSDPSEAEASVIGATLGEGDLAGGATSQAGYPTDGGVTNTASILDADLLGSQVLNFGSVSLPLDQFIDFGQMGTLLSQSTATDELNGEAISGLAGGDGSITLDGADADFGAARVDLLSLFNAAGVGGITDLAIDQADLLLGAGGAHVQAVDGVFQDPDGVGGLGQYRVAEASLLVHSGLIDQAADMMYDAIGDFESQIRDSANSALDLTSVLGLVPGLQADVTVNSNIQQQVFDELLKAPICSSVMVDPATGQNVCDTENTILSIDFSTGTMTIHLDNILDGERPDDPERPTGLNNQDPNTELVDDELYPMIAESIHDVMNAAVDIAAGAVENALDSISFDIDLGIPGASKSLTLGLNGEITNETACDGNVLACAPLNAGMALIRPALSTAAGLANTVIDNGAQQIFDLAIGTVKTDLITVPIRSLAEPFLEILAQFISLQINHQVQETCTLPDGTETIGSLEVSALSLGLLQGSGSDGAARLGLGNAGVRIGACDALAAPALEVETPVVPGDCAIVTSSGWTPNSEVTLQLTDADGNPVGEPVVVTADADGNLPADTCVTIPEGTAPGDYTVVGTDPDGVTAEAPVTVYDPELTAQTPVLPGDCATITSGGWIPGTDVSLQLTDADGNPVGDPVVATADADGNLPADTCVTVPEGTEPGDYTVVGTDPNGNTAEAPLEVAAPGTPILDAGSPVPAGNDIPVTSGGWEPDTEITLQLTDPEGNPVGEPVVVTTDGDGNIPDGTVIPVPEDAEPGDYTVVGTNPDGDTAEDVVTVYAPTLEAQTPVAPEDCATVTSGGWIPGSTVTLQLTDADGNPVGEPVTAVADVDGNLPAETCVTIPAGTPNGDYTIVATDPTGAEVTAPVTVDDAALTPTLEAGSPVPAGGETPLTSGGWAPGSDVTFQVTDADGNPVGDPITVTTDGDGNIPDGTTLPIPEGTEPGDYTVTGTDPDGNTAEAPVSVYAPTLEAGSPVPAGGESPLTSGGWLPNTPVTFQLTDADGNPVGDPITVTTDGEGNIPADTVLPVPPTATPGDGYTVVGTDENGAEVSAPLEVTAPVIDPTLEAGSPLPAGGTSPLTSGGWLPNSEVTFQLRDPEMNPIGDPITVTTDGEGNIPADTTLPIPADAVAGDYTVVGTDADGNDAAAPIEVYAPTIEATSPVVPGATTEVTSGGWLPNSDVTLQLTDADGNAVGDPVTVTTDGDGNVPAGTTLPIPADAVEGDTFTVVGTDENGAEVSAPVEVVADATAPTLEAGSPVPAGGTSPLTSGGWAPDTEVSFQLTDPEGNPVGEPVTVTTDGDGNIPDGTVIPVPADAEAGDYTVVGTDPEGVTAEAPVAVYAPAIEATSPVAPGATTEVTSGGWLPNSEVTLQLTDADGNPAGDPVVVTTDGDGNVPAGTTLPTPADAVDGDTFTVVGTDENGAEVSAPVEIVDDAAAPTLEVTPTVPAGDDIEVTSGGWEPNTEVTLQLADADGTAVGEPVVVTTDGDGNVPAGTVIPVPLTTEPGDFTVTATDPEGTEVSAPVEVTAPVLAPTLEAVSPVLAGDTSELTSGGWVPGSTVTFQLRDADMNPVGEPVEVTIDGDGNVPAGTVITTPADQPGSFTVVGTDEFGNDAAAPVVAYDPTITATSPVTAGSATEVTSAGWLPNSEVTLQLTDAAGNPAGDPVVVTTDGDGNVPAGTILTVPADAAAGDTFTVVGTDENGAEVSAPVEVVAGPAVPWIDPAAPAPAGGELPVVSGGWTPDTEVSFQLTDAEGNPVGEPVVVTTDGDGNVPAGTVIPVPADAEAGDYTVVGTDPEGATAEAPASVYAPDIAATSPVTPGSTTEVTSGGWVPNSEVTLQLTDADGNAVGDPVTVTVDGDGSVPAGTTLAIPADAVAGDTFTVVGSDANGAEVSAPVEVVAEAGDPTLEVTSPVAAGGETEVTSGGWEPNTPVTLQLTDADGNPVGDPVTVTTDGDGNVPAGTTLPIPEGTEPGDYTVTASDPDGTEVSAPIEITAAPAGTPTIDATSPVPAGGETEVTSGGWAPNTRVMLRLLAANTDPVGEPVEVTTDGDGDVPAGTVIAIPEDATAGTYSASATDDAGVTVADAVEVYAPAVTVDDEVDPGECLAVSSTGWVPGSEVTIQLLDADGDVVGEPLVLTADEDGNLPAGTCIDVPADAEPGDDTVEVSDGDTSVSAPTTVVAGDGTTEPAITVDDATPNAGDTIEATGTGYTPGTGAEVQLFAADESALLAEPVPATVESDGTFQVDVVLPADTTPGDYTVTGDGSDGLTAGTLITVSAAATGEEDASGDVNGDGTADGVDDASGDASGDATADATGAATADASGDATGDANGADAAANGNANGSGAAGGNANGSATANGSGNGNGHDPLAATGTDLSTALPFGLLLLVAGAVLVIARRKKVNAKADD